MPKYLFKITPCISACMQKLFRLLSKIGCTFFLTLTYACTRLTCNHVYIYIYSPNSKDYTRLITRVYSACGLYYSTCTFLLLKY